MMVACWGSFVLVATSIHPGHSTFFMSSSPDKLLEEIEATYQKQGFRPETITAMMGNFHQTCDRMSNQQCVDYLRSSLQTIKNAHYSR
jgi:hypothetical protein